MTSESSKRCASKRCLLHILLCGCCHFRDFRRRRSDWYGFFDGLGSATDLGWLMKRTVMVSLRRKVHDLAVLLFFRALSFYAVAEWAAGRLGVSSGRVLVVGRTNSRVYWLRVTDCSGWFVG